MHRLHSERIAFVSNRGRLPNSHIVRGRIRGHVGVMTDLIPHLAGSGLIAGAAGHAATSALGGALALNAVLGLLKPRMCMPPAGALGRPSGRSGDRDRHWSDGRFRYPCRPLSRLSWAGAGRTSFRRSVCPSPFLRWRWRPAWPRMALCPREPRVPARVDHGARPCRDRRAIIQAQKAQRAHRTSCGWPARRSGSPGPLW
jgi:hypothetical protein